MDYKDKMSELEQSLVCLFDCMQGNASQLYCDGHGDQVLSSSITHHRAYKNLCSILEHLRITHLSTRSGR